MSPLLDGHWALAAVILLPTLGALFALAMPSADRLALRYVGLGAALGVVGLIVWKLLGALATPIALELPGVRLTLDALSVLALLSLAIATPVALRSGAPRIFERTQFYVVTLLFAEALFVAAILIEAPFIRLVVAALGAVPFFALVALFGGPLRGTTTMRAAMVWLTVDTLALAVLAWLAARAGVDVTRADAAALRRAVTGLDDVVAPWVVLALAAPGLVRLAAGPFSLWVASFLEEAPVSAAILAASGAAPLGTLLIAHLAVPACAPGVLVLLSWTAVVGAVAALLSGLMAVAERDLRRLVAHLVQAAGAASAVAMLALDERALAVGVLHSVAAGASAGMALAAIEAVERRAETRDAVELAGLGQANPLLALLLVVGLSALAGVPVLGAGATLWQLVDVVARMDVLVAAGLPTLVSVWIAIGLVVGALVALAGVAAVARRLLQPAPPRKASHIVEVLTFAQGLRLLVPAAFVVAMAVGAQELVDTGAAAARSSVQAARVAAGAPSRAAPSIAPARTRLLPQEEGDAP